MAERTDALLIERITDEAIGALNEPGSPVADWNRRMYHVQLRGSFAPHGHRVRSQLEILRLEDPDLILARSHRERPFVVFGAQWRHVLEQFDPEQFDSDELASTLLQLYRHDLYPDRVARIEAFQNSTRALTALAADLTPRLSSPAIEAIAAKVPVADIAPTPGEALSNYRALIENWYETIQDPGQREALTLGAAANPTVPYLGGAADPGRHIVDLALPPADERTQARASARRAAVAATYLSIGISDEPREDGEAAAERLDLGRLYWLWITLGPPISGGIGTHVQPIRPEALTGTNEVVVALFPDEGLVLSADPATITFRSDGTSHFVPVTADLPQLSHGPGSGRAWIGLQAPERAGTWYVRCGVFVRGVLVHVETLTVAVGSSPDICEHRTTFRTLGEGGSSQLDLLEAPTLTMYANQSGSMIDLCFYVPGEDPVAAPGSVEAAGVRAQLSLVRSLLSTLTYGSSEPYGGQDDRYKWSAAELRFTSNDLGLDICTLAQGGRVVWNALLRALAKRQSDQEKLWNCMRRPGSVEIVLKRDAQYVLPVQVFYDHPLVTAGSPADLELCQQSSRWLVQPDGELGCLRNGCPEYENAYRVCLSGFWGLRHAVSTQLPVETDCAPWPITRLAEHDLLGLDHALSTESDIQYGWPRHHDELEKHAHLRNVPIGPEDGTRSWVRALATGSPPGHLLYFLTHMEIDAEGQVISFNRVSGPRLDTSAIFDAKLQLCGNRPLVFLNGCQSAGQDPLTLLSLINDFLERGASGAVGTEVTVFLDTATRFAEAFVAAFNDAPLGEAMRLARWELLRKGSPLGLIYLSFGLVNLYTPRAPALSPGRG